MKRILVGVDRTPESLAAARMAAELLANEGGRLLLVHVMQAKSDRWDAAEREPGQRLLREIKARIAREGVTIETAILDGSPAKALARLAADRGVDLVVVGH